MEKLVRGMWILLGAGAGLAVAATLGFGVALAVQCLSNGGRLPGEMAGGFVLFYSVLVGAAAGLVGLFVGGTFTSRWLSDDDEPPVG